MLDTWPALFATAICREGQRFVASAPAGPVSGPRGPIAGPLPTPSQAFPPPLTGSLLLVRFVHRRSGMGRPLRYLPDQGAVVEVTTRTLQGRLLLRPSPELNELLVGVLGRALERQPGVSLHAVAHLSNHVHLLLSVPNAGVLADFMCFVNGNLAREAGRLHDWRERFWGRRYRCIPVLDDEAAEDRLYYLLAHGCKEGFVRSPLDWPGVSCARALIADEPLRGAWMDRASAYEAERRGQKADPGEFAQSYDVHLEPLPAWRSLTKEERHARIEEMVRDIEREASSSVAAPASAKRRICSEPPHRRPARSKRSPAPPCHASRPSVRSRFVDAYAEFVRLFRDAARRHRRLSAKACRVFPPGCFPPPAPFIMPDSFPQPP